MKKLLIITLLILPGCNNKSLLESNYEKQKEVIKLYETHTNQLKNNIKTLKSTIDYQNQSINSLKENIKALKEIIKTQEEIIKIK